MSMNYLDMLAKLGIGNAHPGGFTATLEWLRTHPIEAGSRILEVGCGTGRTACHLAKLGHRVTAVDIRSDMLDKAKHRAKLEGTKVDFVQGKAEELPFSAGSFDMVVVESVTIFADSRRALAEYFRVLVPGGRLFDREMIAVKPLSSKLESTVNDYYGVQRVWSVSEWQDLLEEAGFVDSELLNPGVFDEWDWKDEMQYPDTSMVTDPNVYLDERIWTMSRKYDEIMVNYGDHFGFGLWSGRKPE